MTIFLCIPVTYLGGLKAFIQQFLTGEQSFLVKRSAIQAGLHLMLSRELIKVVFAAEGILYQATNLTGRFVRLLMSQYSKELAERASWVTKQFYEYTDEELASYISQNVGQWGSEFDRLTAIDLLDL
ncbi:ABC-three component system middle component 2 [Escherichia coli]